MNILSNAELNKLKNVEYTLENGVKNIIVRFEERDQHFGPDISEFFENMEKSRCQEINFLKKGIHNITESLWSKLDLLKNNKIGAIKDFDKLKQELIDIQENILNTKITSKLELDKLSKIEDDLNDEFHIYYNGKVAEWSVVLDVNMTCEFIPAKVKSKNTGEYKEINQFFDFLHQSGGHENGWRKEDHLLFLKLRNKYKHIDVVAKLLHEIFPDISLEEIKSHEEWYKNYLKLQAKKKEAINRWKQTKSDKNLSQTFNNVENMKYNMNLEDDGTKLKEKLMQWKTEKEEKLFKEKELEKQRLLDRIERERLEKHRQIEIKNLVNEWKQSKIILEQTKKQNSLMFEEMERKRRATSANKLIKQFQSMDEHYILKMREMHRKLTGERPRRAQSGPPVLRDPKRLMQPTEQWAHRVRSIREPLRGPLPLYAAPKLAIPEWRKNIT